MVTITYLTLRAPHLGHITWLKAMKALGHSVKIVSLRAPVPQPLERGGVLLTEGVKPTVFGAARKVFHRKWAAVACSPAILKPAVYAIYAMPDLVVSVSSLVKELLGRDSVVLYPSPPELEALFKMSSDAREPWVCFSGAFLPIKGLHMIPDIAFALKNEGIKTRFILAGGTEKEPVSRLIVAKAKRLGVQEYLKIAGRLPRVELFKLLRRCSLYLQPALFDAFPISVVEAMALGVVPVVTKRTGSRDLVRLVDETLVRDVEPSGLASALARLLMDQKTLKEYSIQCKEIVKNTLSFKNIMEKINIFIERCLE